MSGQKAETGDWSREIGRLEAEIREKQRRLRQIRNSPSWKVTAPLRFLGGLVVAARAKCRAWRRRGHEADAVLAGLKAGILSGVTRNGSLAVRDRIYESERLREARVVFSGKPKISVITPLYNTPPRLLAEMVFSVLEQTYGEWELCLADASDAAHGYVGEIISFFTAKDKRVKYRKLPSNGGISLNSNAAIGMATGEYIAILDHDDLLHPAALFKVAEAIDREGADLVYSDECTVDAETGKMTYVNHKPDFSPDFLRCQNYICHLMVFSKALMEKAGGPFRREYDGSQDHDLVLRLSERASRIVHIPEVLYFWRAHAQSCAAGLDAKPYVSAAGIAAVEASLRRAGLSGKVGNLPCCQTMYRVQYDIARPWLVSIVIPMRNRVDLLRRCLDSIDLRTTWRNYEIIVVDNASDDPETLGYLARLEREGKARVLRYDAPFNYSKINNFAAGQARGDMLLFLNNDTEVISRRWIEEMLMFAQRDDVGVVGAMLYFPDDTIQHAGVVVNGLGVAQHLLRGRPRGYSANGHGINVKNYTAVTGACMMMRTDVFKKAGGFYEGLAVAFNDVDLCLRIRKAGYLVVWTPFAELYHYESVSRGLDTTPEKQKRFWEEAVELRKRHRDVIAAGDPYYNRNFSISTSDFIEDEPPAEVRAFVLRRLLGKVNRELSSVRGSLSWRLLAPARQLLGPGVFRGKAWRAGRGKFLWRRLRRQRSLLFVSHELSKTGAPHLLADVVRIALGQGDKVTVVSPVDGPLHQDLAALGATVVIDDSFFFNLFEFRRFAEKFAMVFCNTVVVVPAVIALSSMRIPVAWWIHEGGVAMELAKGLMPRQLPENTKVYVVHDYCARSLLRFGFDYASEVLRYGISPAGVKKRAARPVGGPLVFAVVGSVEPQKGQDVFVEAVKLLPPEERRKARFLILGRHVVPDFHGKLVASAAGIGEIEFREPIPHGEMADFYAGVDCVVVSSREDAQPLVVPEAAQQGVPSIVSDHTGTADNYSGALAELIFKSESPEELAEKMRKVIGAPAWTAAMGALAKKKLGKLYDAGLFRRKIVRILSGNDRPIAGDEALFKF